jgi:hypothetical protein
MGSPTPPSNRQVNLANCGPDWVERATTSKQPMKITGRLKVEVHGSAGDLIRLVEHVPHRNRKTASLKEVCRIIGDSEVPPATVIQLALMRASWLDQNIDGLQVTDLAFSVDASEQSQRIAVAVVVGGQKLGCIKKPTKEHTLEVDIASPSSVRSGAEYLLDSLLVSVATTEATQARLTRRMAAKAPRFTNS